MKELKPINEARQGRFLVAEPTLLDQSFNRTVVMLTEHNDDGSVGFVLNKPMELKLHELVPDLPMGNFPIFFGGPVQNDRIFYIHSLGDHLPGSIAVANGVFWGGDFEMLKMMIRNGEVELNSIRFFMGYSGWGSNQLIEELDEKSWVVLEQGTLDPLVDAPETLWKKILLNLGNDYKIWANAPKDPMLN